MESRGRKGYICGDAARARSTSPSPRSAGYGPAAPSREGVALDQVASPAQPPRPCSTRRGGRAAQGVVRAPRVHHPFVGNGEGEASLIAGYRRRRPWRSRPFSTRRSVSSSARRAARSACARFSSGHRDLENAYSFGHHARRLDHVDVLAMPQKIDGSADVPRVVAAKRMTVLGVIPRSGRSA